MAHIEIVNFQAFEFLDKFQTIMKSYAKTSLIKGRVFNTCWNSMVEHDIIDNEFNVGRFAPEKNNYLVVILF